MSSDEMPRRRVPVWMMVIIIVAALPALLLPALIAMADEESYESKKLFIWLFPFYLVVAGFLAWQCYGRRTEMSWILVALMFLTDGAMAMLMAME